MKSMVFLKSFFNVIKICFFSLIILECENNHTPMYPLSAHYTSNAYEWKVDTLQAPETFQILMRGVWGSDENNVWVVGHSDVNEYQAWYWNGEKWGNLRLWFPGHPHSLTAIHGFSPNDIWIVGWETLYPISGFSNFIIHFNGYNWELIKDIKAPWCFTIWGVSNNYLFVGSDSGLILYFNGSYWQRQSTGTKAQILDIWGFSENEIYASGVQFDNTQPLDTSFYYLFKFNYSDWQIINIAIDHSVAPPVPFGMYLWGDEHANLYSVGSSGLFKMVKSSWINLLNGAFYAINGTGWNNIFIGGPANNIYHFNGEFWNRFDFFDKYFFDGGFDFWCNSKYVFMTAQERNRSYIIRGKLIEP